MGAAMSQSEVAQLVGANRHEVLHVGRYSLATRSVLVLHSVSCIERGRDLRDCAYSRALAGGVTDEAWKGYEDRPVVLGLIPGFWSRDLKTFTGRLIPLRQLRRREPIAPLRRAVRP